MDEDAELDAESGNWEECWDCGGEGYTHHDCGEDCCACAEPIDNVVCRTCEGRRGWYMAE